MTLSNSDIVELIDFRHALHRRPELSGEEAATAKAVVAFLTPTRPDQVITGLGGHGVAAVYEGQAPGPTVLFRSELDAVPPIANGPLTTFLVQPGSDVGIGMRLGGGAGMSDCALCRRPHGLRKFP